MEGIFEKIDSMLRYRDALGPQDQETFDRLVVYAQSHVSACARAEKLSVFESMLLAMVLEQQKKIDQLVAKGA